MFDMALWFLRNAVLRSRLLIPHRVVDLPPGAKTVCTRTPLANICRRRVTLDIAGGKSQ
jgi:hypothetical protein